MSFVTDKQTLEDLGILGKFKPHSVYAIFNKVKTAGGERLLNEMFHAPLKDPLAINARSASFQYFQDSPLRFPYEAKEFSVVENYLTNGTYGNRISSAAGMAQKKWQQVFLRDEQYAILQSGLSAAIEALCVLKELTDQLNIPMALRAKEMLSDQRLGWLKEERGNKTISLLKAARYDHLLRHQLRSDMDLILDLIYQLDVYMAVAGVARERNFSYAEALPASDNVLQSAALQHPGIPRAVANPVHLNSGQNLIFLTGANMAGKSTLMKAVGIAVYLAHMGFPVAARHMRFSVRDGLYTSINVPDNLEMGYSHFYAEVLRVKKVAQEVSSGKKLVVIFDELFKGTNVKDAYDATLAVTRSFSAYKNCFFIISTHIIEVGDALRKESDSILYAYLPTIMNGNIPSYPYILTEGITSDRQGMIIIENEKILDLLNA